MHIHDTVKASFFSDLSTEAQDAAWQDVLESQSHASFTHKPSFIAADIHVPKTYVICENDKVLAAAKQELVVKIGGFDNVERMQSGHFPFLSMPKETAEIFARLALS